MLFKNKFIFSVLFLIFVGCMPFSYGMHGWFKRRKENFSQAKKNIKNKIVKKVVYYRHHDFAREKAQNNVLTALLFGTGIYAGIDIYNNHLEDIATTTISDLLETESGRKIIDESVQKMVESMKKSMIKSIDEKNIADITTNLLKAILKKGLKEGFIIINESTGMPKFNSALSLIPNKKIDNAVSRVLGVGMVENSITLSSELIQDLTKNQLEKLINSEEFHDILTQSTKILVDYALSPETSKLSPEIKNILDETFKEEIDTLQSLAGVYAYVGAVKVMPIVSSPYISALQNFNLFPAIAISTAGTLVPLNLLCKVLDKESVMKIARATINFDDNFNNKFPRLYKYVYRHIKNYTKFFLNRYEQLSLEENYLTKEESIIPVVKEGSLDTLKKIGEDIAKKNILDNEKILNIALELNKTINSNIKSLQ